MLRTCGTYIPTSINSIASSDTGVPGISLNIELTGKSYEVSYMYDMHTYRMGEHETQVIKKFCLLAVFVF